MRRLLNRSASAKPALMILGVMVLFLTLPLAAQIEKTLRFTPETVDFGNIREEDGKVTRKVKAVNISGEETFIISARTSCGCTSVEYPETMLAPGDSTIITLTYDPLNRPGKFLKTTKVFTGKERIGNSFKLKGTVIPSKKNLDRIYPDEAGPLRLSTRFITTGDLSSQEARPLFVGIYNNSDSTLVLRSDSDHPLESAIAPDTIEAFGVGTLTLMLKGRNFNPSTDEFIVNSYITDALSGDTITRIPVTGRLVKK